MPALVAGIHVFAAIKQERRGWPGRSPVMTADGSSFTRIGLRFDLRIVRQTAISVQAASLRAPAKQSIECSHAAAFSRRDAPEFAKKFIRPLKQEGAARPSSEGAGKAECPLHPRPVCRKWKHTAVTTGVGGSVRPSLRNGFNGFLRALPSDRAFLPLSSV